MSAADAPATSVPTVPDVPVNRLASLVNNVCDSTATLDDLGDLLDEFHGVLNPVIGLLVEKMTGFALDKRPFQRIPDFPMMGEVRRLREILVQIRKALRIHDGAITSHIHTCHLEGDSGCTHPRAITDPAVVADATLVRTCLGEINSAPVSRVGGTYVLGVPRDIKEGGIQCCEGKRYIAEFLVEAFAERFGKAYNLCTLCCSDHSGSDGRVVSGYFRALNMPDIQVTRSSGVKETGWKINPDVPRFYLGIDEFFYLDSTWMIRVTKEINGMLSQKCLMIGRGLELLDQQ